MEYKDIINWSTRTFSDISSEKKRVYRYPLQHSQFPFGQVISRVIDFPIGLSVSDSGHYVIDSTGWVHFMPKGFIELSWVPKDGCPHIVQ